LPAGCKGEWPTERPVIRSLDRKKGDTNAKSLVGIDAHSVVYRPTEPVFCRRLGAPGGSFGGAMKMIVTLSTRVEDHPAPLANEKGR
jgi:hypothetical protein